jgi:PnrA-like ABC transporter substrate-binding protein
VVIALGGNALLKRDDKGTFEEQFRNVELAAKGIANLIENNYRIVLTHGNGPQVGSTLIRHDAAKKTVPSFPLHACNAETQGFIGYMIVQALQNELDKRRLDKAVVAVVSRVVVDENDPSFKNPTKPIGPYFERSQYANLVNILDGYRLGAKYVNPNVKVMGSYLGDWDSPEKGKEAALLQINSGADLILHVADTSGKGVIEAAKEKGVFAFGAVGDQHQLAPKAVLTSFVLDIDKAFDHALRMVAEGRFEGKIFKPGIEAGKGASGEGIVYLAPFNELDSEVPDDVKAKLQQLTQDVIDKKILVPERIKATSDIAVTANLGDQAFAITGISSDIKANSATINSGVSVQVEFDKAGEVELTLPKSMIDGISMVKAGDAEVPFETISTSDTASTIRFTVPEGSSSVEISGATVVPEFGLIAVLILGAVLVAVIGLARFKGSWMNLERF